MAARNHFEYLCDVCRQRCLVLESGKSEISFAEIIRYALDIGWRYRPGDMGGGELICRDCSYEIVLTTSGVRNGGRTRPRRTGLLAVLLLIFIAAVIFLATTLYDRDDPAATQVKSRENSHEELLYERDETADIAPELVEKIEKDPEEYADKLAAVSDPEPEETEESPVQKKDKPSTAGDGEYRLISTAIKESLYASAMESGLSAQDVTLISKLMGEKINLARAIHPGDLLKVALKGDTMQAFLLKNTDNRFFAYRPQSKGEFVFYQPDISADDGLLKVLPFFPELREEPSEPEAKTPKPRIHGIYAFYSGNIDNTISQAAKKVGLSYSHVLTLKHIFSYSVNFRNLRKGDTFAVLFERDDLVKNGGKAKIIAAEIVANGKKYQRFRFKDKNGKYAYYSVKNRNGPASSHKKIKKITSSGFLRYPLRYKRISSHFNLRRRHPISGKIRAHKGTDFAAPRGTRVKATADGTVSYSGWQRGYGYVVKIDHYKGKYTTVYAHLSKIHKRAKKKGNKVKKNYVIGYVGSTGYSTGPHLHYEFRVQGRAVNPLKVKLPGPKVIVVRRTDKKELKKFVTRAQLMRDELNYCGQNYQKLAYAN